MQTSTTENYLKQLLLLQQRQHEAVPVPTGKLASSLDVTPGTATVMVKGMAESGLMDYESRSGVRLTAEGERLALDVLRRHRIVELFLVKVLGLDWSEVHDEAEILEHAVSVKVLQRMDELLGHPAFDPHGDPIPNAAGIVESRQLLRLDQCQAGQAVLVSQIENQDPQFLRFVDSRGLTPGAELTVIAADPLADAVTIRRPMGDLLVIGTAAARKILVSVQ
jgi:DtxR family Mn-dependent transcriptional regulator